MAASGEETAALRPYASPPASSSRGGPVRRMLVPGSVGLALLALLGACAAWILGQSASSRHDLLVHNVLPAWHTWMTTVLNPYYWAFLVFLSVVQWIRPARRSQRSPSVAIAQDSMWFFFSTGLEVSVVAGFLALLSAAYTRVSGDWHVSLIPLLGIWGVAVFALVISDGLNWLSHWLHHHIATLWLFHAVHHSQENLNVLSDNREHIVETIISGALAYFPAVMLGLTTPDAIRLAFVTIYFSAFIHSNIRTDLGPLRFVLVSPQAHRVHHSIDPGHFNTNYATLFAFWDYLFGTRHPDRHSYPATGIDDPFFPHQARANPLSLALLWAKQSLYPFKLAVRNVSGYAGNMRARGLHRPQLDR
jgi:sterol desaturase/sphingolipid hydroxylase (fatty acid hydroxylase superfamily)